MERYFKPIKKQAANLVQHGIKLQASESQDEIIDESDDEATTLKSNMYKHIKRCELMKSLHLRETGFVKRKRNSKTFLNTFNRLLATKLHVQPTQVKEETVGKSVVSYSQCGNLIAIADSRPSLTLYRTTEVVKGTQGEDTADCVYELPKFSPLILLGSGSFGSDSVSSVQWDPLNIDCLAISMAFDPDIQVFNINNLAQGDCLSERYRSNHSVGHECLLFGGDVKDDGYMVAGGTRGHIRCWRKEQLNKPLWVIKRVDVTVKALAFVQLEDKPETDRAPLKVRTAPIVLNSKSGRLGLKRKTPPHDISQTSNSSSSQGHHKPSHKVLNENKKPHNFSTSEKETSKQCHRPIGSFKTVLVAAFGDGSISLWDIQNIKVRFVGSTPSPSIIATFNTRDIFQPLASLGWNSVVSGLSLSDLHPKTQLLVSLTSGCCARFQLSNTGKSVSLLPIDILRLGIGHKSKEVQYTRSSSVSLCSASGACTKVNIHPCFKDDILHIKLNLTGVRTKMHSLGDLLGSEICRHIVVEANPKQPSAALFINHKLVAVVKP